MGPGCVLFTQPGPIATLRIAERQRATSLSNHRVVRHRPAGCGVVASLSMIQWGGLKWQCATPSSNPGAENDADGGCDLGRVGVNVTSCIRRRSATHGICQRLVGN